MHDGEDSEEMADDQVEEDEGVLDVQASLITDTYYVYS
jgi:hypothetical protein